MVILRVLSKGPAITDLIPAIIEKHVIGLYRFQTHASCSASYAAHGHEGCHVVVIGL